MIRQATKYDKNQIIDLMEMFRNEADFKELNEVSNLEWWNTMLDTIFAGQGAIFIEDGKGLLMSMVLPTIWCNKTYVLHELAWYVTPNSRKSSVGYRLFKSYIEYGNKLKDAGRIKYFTISKLDTSTGLKYEKYGFRKKDENWIQ